MDFDRFIEFPQVRASIHHRKPNSVQCFCPCHDDRQASLTISRGRNGGAVMHDHAGCSNEAILGAWGLKMADLMPDNDSYSDNVPRWIRFIQSVAAKSGHTLEAYYHYSLVPSGEYAYTRLRYNPKTFRIGKLQNERFTYSKGGSVKDVPAVYCKSFTGVKKAIAEGKPVFYVEGEKDVNTLYSKGYAAVTCGSAEDWKKSCIELFRGADVVILADNDRSGIKLANDVKADLQEVAKSVKIVLPCPDVPKADVSDYFAAGHSKEEFEKLIQSEYTESESGELTPEPGSEPVKREPGELDRFHIFNAQGKITGVFDFAIFEQIKNTQPMFVMGGVPYLYKNGVYAADETGAQLKTAIRDLLYPVYKKSNIVKRVYDLFLIDAELQTTFEGVNKYPPHWINFENGFYDVKTGRMEPHKPEYRAINQIPHEYRPDATPEGGAAEEWLQFICPEADDREMLLQYMGLTLTLDVSQQKFLVLCGEGGSGKSTLIRLNEAMTGSRNVSNISLTELQQRFASFGLMGKLLNSCADLEIAALEDTSTLKKCLGEDTLRGEQKGRDAISFKSYAKLIFSTNELPLIKSEKTNGFYRRLLVLPMDKVPKKKNADLFSELAAQIDYFIRLSVEALGRMYKAGEITESRASMAAVSQLRCDSDTVQAFLEEETSRKEGSRIDRGTLFAKYEDYCRSMDRQSLSRNNFYKSLRAKGFKEIRLANGRFFGDISFDKTDTDLSEKVSQDGFIDLPEGLQEELPFD